jgi:hypothetical protein
VLIPRACATTCSSSCAQPRAWPSKHRANEIEVLLLNSVSDRHDQAVIAGYVETWKARYGRASVEIHRS